MTRLFKRLPISMTIGLFLILFILIPSIIVSTLISSTASFIIKDRYSKDFINLITDSVNNNISMIITKLNLTALAMTQNPGVYNSLYGKLPAELRRNTILSYLQMMVDKTPYVSCMEFYADNGEVYRYPFDSDFPSVDKDFFKPLNKRNIRIGEQYIDYRGKSYLPVGKVIYQFERNFVMGTTVMYVDSSVFKDVFSTLPINSSNFYITVNSSIIFNFRDDNIGKLLYIPDLTSYGVDETAVGYTESIMPVSIENLADEVKITAIISHKDIYKAMKKANRRILRIICITSLVALLIAFLIPRRVVSDIKALTKSVLAVKKHNKLYKVSPTNNEIYILQHKFNDMFEEIKRLINLNNQTQRKKLDAEFQALQAQITPHFLYNSLDSICCMAKLNNQPDIENLAYSISEYYRYAFADGSFVIPMSDEINHVRNYLLIKKTNYPDLFDFEIDIPNNILQINVIKFILQPIVENSIKHGFKDISYRGFISITGEITPDDDILLIITDNGCGMDFNPLNKSTAGYGVKNINERIRLASDEHYGLMFNSLPSLGTKVTVRLPKQYRKNSADSNENTIEI